MASQTPKAPEPPIPGSEGGSLKHQFLLAMPLLREGLFAGSITYLCEHDARGAMGLIVNRPLRLSLGDICDHLEVTVVDSQREQTVLAGGPVQPDHGFVLHRTESTRSWDATLVINEELSLTSSRDILVAMGAGEGPSDALIALGYAGWGAGQLEDEIADNAWLTLPADTAILFDHPPERRASAAAARFGIDLGLLSAQAGHA